MKCWQIDKKKTKDHWLEIEDPEKCYDAVVKWDGCINLYKRYPDELEGDPDYVHICDLDDFINRLLELKRIALQHFGEDWPR